MEKLFFVIPLFSLAMAGCLGPARPGTPSNLYAIGEIPTPVLNTPSFSSVFGGQDGKTLHLDGCGQIRELEFIALPQTVFKIEEAIESGKTVIFRVTTKEYSYPTAKGYFVDSRFVKTTRTEPPERPKALPPRQTILEKLILAKGIAYTWGGNYRQGIPELLSLYPLPADASISPEVKSRWMLQGLDCSGLLYEATNGYTPRNTSSLVHFGVPVRIAGLQAGQIMKKVESLDIIVWPGHMLIILDRERAIESRLDCSKEKGKGPPGGVRIRPLREALNEILERRIPADQYGDQEETEKRKFVIRRWYGAIQTPGG